MSGGQGRREARRFEPPPWERDQFEELARLREAETARSPLAEERQAEVPAEAAAPQARPAIPTATGQVTEPERENDGPVLDQAGVDMMLMQLRQEDPPAEKKWQALGLYAGAAIGVIGASLMVLGAIVGARLGGTGLAGAFGSATLLAIGFVFLLLAALVVRGVRRRGEV